MLLLHYAWNSIKCREKWKKKNNFFCRCMDWWMDVCKHCNLKTVCPILKNFSPKCFLGQSPELDRIFCLWGHFRVGGIFQYKISKIFVAFFLHFSTFHDKLIRLKQKNIFNCATGRSVIALLASAIEFSFSFPPLLHLYTP